MDVRRILVPFFVVRDGAEAARRRGPLLGPEGGFDADAADLASEEVRSE